MSITNRLDGLAGSAPIKVPCRVATTGAIVLTGEQTIDGVACVAGDRVLVKDQSNPVANGIYVVDYGDWDRSKDFDGADDVVYGTICTVLEGTTYPYSAWLVIATDPVVINTSSITFQNALFSSAQIISFINSGTGAVSRPLQEKVRDLPASPEDFAVSTSGDQTADMQNLFQKDNVLLSAGTFLTTTGGVSIRNKVEGSPGALLQGSNASAAHDYQIVEDNAVLRDVNIDGVGVIALALAANLTDIELYNTRIRNRPGSSAHHGIYVNVAGTGDFKMIGGEIDVDGYAFVLDDEVDTNGWVLLGVKLTSQYSDALEINCPTQSAKDGSFVGNILTATTTGSNTGSGFAIGSDSGQNMALVANVIPQSRREAVHLEDRIKNMVFLGNVGRDLKRDGLLALPDATGEGRGIVFIGQSFEADSASSGFTGMQVSALPPVAAKAVASITRSGSVATVTTVDNHGFYTGQSNTVAGADQTEYNTNALIEVTGLKTFTYYVNGSPATPATGTITTTGSAYGRPANVLTNNIMRDFDVGARPGLYFQIVDKNVFEEATTAGLLCDNSFVIGDNLMSQQVGRPAALISFAGSGGFFGKVYSDKTPTAVMTRSSTGLLGMMRGFGFPMTPYVHAGGTTDSVPIVALPDLAYGRIRVRIQQNVSASSYSYMSADIHWDGTTLIVQNAIRRNVGGTAGATTMSNTGGNLTLPVFTASASVFHAIVDFEGEWIKL